MTRRELFTAFLAAIGLVVGVKTGGVRPVGAAGPPDPTLHSQVFS